MIIPLITIPVKSSLPINSTLERFTLSTGQLIQGEPTIENSQLIFTFQNVLIALFIIISSTLLIRFALNIIRISKKILLSKKVAYSKTTIVLVEERTLPYSFFRYIFVNQSDYENGKIEKELLMHEEAHCVQSHSIDIILIELINVIFWFNPAIWLFKRAILLNHEYYADNKVLSFHDRINYQELLVNLVFQSNSISLVSNFNYSLIKSRLIMMTIDKPIHNVILKKSFSVLLLLSLAVVILLGQGTDPSPKSIGSSKDTLTLNISYVDSSQKITSLTGDVTIKVSGFNNIQIIIKSESAIVDAEKRIIIAHNGTLESYNFGELKPYKTLRFKELNYDKATQKVTFKNFIGLTRQAII